MSTIIASNVSDGTLSIPTTYVTNGSARAWNNTNSSGTAINDSFNISSLTDVDVGRQQHNVSSAFSNGFHTPVFSMDNNFPEDWTSALTSTKWRTNVYTGSTYQDAGIRTSSHGDLA